LFATAVHADHSALLMLQLEAVSDRRRLLLLGPIFHRGTKGLKGMALSEAPGLAARGLPASSSASQLQRQPAPARPPALLDKEEFSSKVASFLRERDSGLRQLSIKMLALLAYKRLSQRGVSKFSLNSSQPAPRLRCKPKRQHFNGKLTQP